MSDFAQTGLISTLQQLNAWHLPRIEQKLTEHAPQRPITLVMPCHASELGTPALTHIVQELKGASFLREVIVAINGTTGSADSARSHFASLPQPHRVLHIDEPRVIAALSGMLGRDVRSGKGLNVWATCGLICNEATSATIVTQDCDVLSFRRENLARLCFAAAHPELRYDLAKMYYSRATDRLYGRVSRLFLTPLLEALLRVVGHLPLLDFLRSFRYPLSGECAMARDLVDQLPMQSGWALEIGLLCAAFRSADPRSIAQVDGGGDYDHRHHPLCGEDGALFHMSKEIGGVLLGELVEEGIPVCGQLLGAIKASFATESTEAIRRSRHLALINALSPASDDDAARSLFTRALDAAGDECLSGAPAAELPAWRELADAHPKEHARFVDALRATAE